VLHNNCLYKGANFSLELGLHHVCALLVGYHFDAGFGNLAHVFETGGLLCLVKFKAKLEDGLVLCVIADEGDLLKDGVQHCGILGWTLIRRERHVLELNYSARCCNDVVLGVNLR